MRYKTALAKQPYSVRLALEGALKALELAWKEAEEIAAISDSLFTARHSGKDRELAALS